MRQLYIDCQMGAAGDMLLAALLELTGHEEVFLQKLRNMGILGLNASGLKVEREGLQGTQIQISVEEAAEEGRTLADVHEIIDALDVSENVKSDAKGVYRIIAEAEALVHETDEAHVHFHEVGSLSAIADIVGVCMLMEDLHPDHVAVSPIHVGSGTVKCAHGLLPVPAPATAAILKGLPAYSGDVFGELCTPTGAALLRYFADDFDPIPEMTVMKSGRGFGTKVFPNRINGIQVMINEE